MIAHLKTMAIGTALGLLLSTSAHAAQLDATPSTLISVINGAAAGDTIILANGTYSNKAISFDKDRLSLVAATPGLAVFTGSSSIHFGGDGVVIKGLSFKNGGTDTEVIRFRDDSNRVATNSTVTEIAIHDYNQNVPTSLSKPWVALYGTGNKVTYSAFYKKTYKHAFIHISHVGSSQQLNHLIQNNWFGYRSPGGNDNHALGIGNGALPDVMADVTVKRNYFEACNGEAEIMSIKASGILIAENLISKCQGGIVLRDSKDSIIDRNIFLGANIAGTAGVRFYGSGHTITNNYIGQVKSFGITVGNGDGTLYTASASPLINNNTLVDVGSILIGDKTTYDTAATNVNFGKTLLVKTSTATQPDEIVDSRVIYRALESQSVGYDSTLRDVRHFTAAVTYRTTNGMVYPTATGLTAGAPVASLFVVSRSATGATDTKRVGPTWYTKPTN